MAAPAFGSAGAQVEGTAADFQCPVPSGVAADDVVVVTAFVDSTTTVTGLAPGFANAPFSPVTNNAPSGNHMLYVLWKRASGTDTGTYDFTLSGPAFRSVEAIRYTGCVTSGDPWDIAASAIDITDGNASPAVSVTTDQADTLLVWSATDWAGGTWTPPAGFTKRRDSGVGLCATADKVQASAGSSGAVSGTCTGSGKRTAWLGALKGISSGGTVSKDLSEKYYANQLAGTIVNGIPTLETGAALCKWRALALTNTGVTAANDAAGTSNYAITGALAKAANKLGVEDQLALYYLAGGV